MSIINYISLGEKILIIFKINERKTKDHDNVEDYNKNDSRGVFVGSKERRNCQ